MAHPLEQVAAMKKPQVLVVDDEPQTVKYLSANLRVRGYEVRCAQDGREALQVFERHQFHLAILDMLLPELDGFQVCRALREQSNVPIVVLSALGREKDIVRALDLGADDYLIKPFGVDELLARVRAVLRRTARAPTSARPPLSVNELVINFAERRVTLAGRAVWLTPTEFDLLAHLALNRGRVLTHRALLQAVWGEEYEDEAEYLWTYVRRLRNKLEANPAQPQYIVTEPGVGYRFEAAGCSRGLA